jgi:hypothetical protein
MLKMVIRTTVIYTDHESLRYLATMRSPSKRLARWIKEFGEYDLDIQYRKASTAVVPDAISRRPDLMSEGSRNRAALIATIKGLDEDDWAMYMVRFLKHNIEPPEPFCEDICEAKDFFTNDDEGILLQEVRNQIVPICPFCIPGKFHDKMHLEYGHLGHPGLLGVVNGRGWWHSLEMTSKPM